MLIADIAVTTLPYILLVSSDASSCTCAIEDFCRLFPEFLPRHWVEDGVDIPDQYNVVDTLVADRSAVPYAMTTNSPLVMAGSRHTWMVTTDQCTTQLSVYPIATYGRSVTEVLAYFGVDGRPRDVAARIRAVRSKLDGASPREYQSEDMECIYQQIRSLRRDIGGDDPDIMMLEAMLTSLDRLRAIYHRDCG